LQCAVETALFFASICLLLLIHQSCICRLHYVAPVWYQLRSSGGRLVLTGAHDVDTGWMTAVRQPCQEPGRAAHRARVLPRVIFELQGQEVLEALRQPQEMAALLAGEAEQRGFDGWVRLCACPGSAVGIALRIHRLHRQQAACSLAVCRAATVKSRCTAETRAWASLPACCLPSGV
jgi:hypothetical protein